MGASSSYDRSTEDVGNMVGMEHVNTRVPDQVVATDFYITGMGFTRDPYMNVGTNNMWVNVGNQQFHLPTGEPQVLRGHVGVVVPSLDELAERLDQVRGRLSGTAFTFERVDGYLDVTQPWGNVLRCFASGPQFRTTLGLPYVEFTVPRGTAAGVARFYQQALLTQATLEDGKDGPCARVSAGPGQWLLFRESDAPQAPYDQHHIAIYISEFGRPHRWLSERGLVVEESSQYQFRFQDLVDPDSSSGDVLFTVEHEVRSLTHPMFRRPLVNRNPAQMLNTYVAGRDGFYPEG